MYRFPLVAASSATRKANKEDDTYRYTYPANKL